MDVLPSYSEATTSPDWLSLVAPYIPASSWSTCCLVDRRFCAQFAPRLWQDPLVTIRQLGLHPNDDLAWYRRFIHKYAKSARLETRCMVRSLDFRAFASRASGLYSTEASERAISESFRALPQLFPKLICLLLDGHPELDPGSLATATLTSSQYIELLDFARCRQELSSKLFHPHYFRSLVYLDISHVPGSLRSAIQTSLNPSNLPELRVLKARGREVDNATARLLFQTFRLQLWSIDLSNNKLTDEIIDALLAHCFASLSYHSDAHYEIEGKATLPRSIGSRKYGLFEFIQESAHSASFTHPERYLADAPVYSPRADHAELQEWQTVRSDGTFPPRHDEAGAVKEMLLDDAISAATGMPRKLLNGLHIPRGGVTHIYLNGNNLTTDGIGRLLRTSLGRIEHFECDHCLNVPPISSQNDSRQQIRVEGLFGLSHLFRPVISSNLRSLRVHHSIVTQVPSIIADGLSLATAIRLSEDFFFKSIGRTYPQRFVPNLNPRIASLTLTNIPARSTGPVIEQLSSFLDLVSMQQNAIRQAKIEMDDRHSSILSGLRHLRLELDPDFNEDTLNSSTGRDIDYDRLLDPGDENFDNRTFSFFRDDTEGATSHSTRVVRRRTSNDSKDATPKQYSHWISGRLKSPPYSETESQFIMYQQEASNSWTGNVYSVPVWIGPGTIGSHAAVNEYMWNLQDPSLRTNIGPATPNHVTAGVPAMTYIFYAAWDAMIFPRNLAVAVKNFSSVPLQDVAAEIKKYRLQTRGTANHWDGKIELVRTEKSSRYHASEYWR
ncbi:hypothetical protein F5Y19DRAFT_207317 [Xylariaceae sp. FL1651]|nr:hypothetical protein F5Y19DRAFT_207317 [Xylariaceae sp. FL1651]